VLAKLGFATQMIRARRRSFAKNNLLKQGLRHEGINQRDATEKLPKNKRKITEKSNKLIIISIANNKCKIFSRCSGTKVGDKREIAGKLPERS
jgi:hypothetical protein